SHVAGRKTSISVLCWKCHHGLCNIMLDCFMFHPLPDFDHGKRSCCRRLAGLSEHRRKPPPVTPSSQFHREASSLHGRNICAVLCCS
ncbi:unnamed protein product, partial [Musa hybrid cultivar]